MNYKYIYKYKNELELYEKLVKLHLIFNNIDLNNQQTNILIYFCRWGINQECYDRLLKDKVVPSIQIMRNIKTVLGKMGLIIKKKYNQWEVNSRLQMHIDSSLSVMVLCKI